MQYIHKSHAGHLACIFWFFTANFLIVARGLYNYFCVAWDDKFATMLSDTLHAHFAAYFNPDMPPLMFYYVMGSSLIGIAFILAFFIQRHPKSYPFFHDFKIRLSLLFVTVLCAVCLSATSWLIVFLPLVIIALSLVCPQMIGAYQGKTSLALWLDANLPKLLIITTCLFVFIIFIPFTFMQPKVMNAFLRVPEEYKLVDSKTAEITYVNTTELINRLRLWGDYDKIDIFTHANWKNNRACLQVKPDDPAIKRLVQEYTDQATPEPGSFWHTGKTTIFPPVLSYMEDRLCIIPAYGDLAYLKHSEIELKTRLLAAGVEYNPAPRLDDDAHYLTSEEYLERQRYIRISRDETSFMLNNRGEIRHHIYYMYPTYEYMIGKPLDQISHQYGLGNTLMLAAGLKMYSFFGTPSYALAIKLGSILWYIGFAIFALCISRVLKDLRLAVIPIILLAANYMMREYYVTILVLGVYELRLICSLPALFLLNEFIQTGQRKFFYGLWLVLILAIFLNSEFGLFIAVAALGTLSLKWIINREKLISLLPIVITVVSIALALLCFSIGPSHLPNYFMQGYFSEPLKSRVLFPALGIFIFYFIATIYLYKNNSRFLYPFIFSFFLAQEILCYYIWHGGKNHITMYVAHLSLPAVFLLAFILTEKINSAAVKKCVYYGALIFAVATTWHYAKNFIKDSTSMRSALEYHKVYEWTQPTAGFKSTMNPDFFIRDIELIKKYVPGKETFIISYYDFFLNFFAGKYTGLPHFEMTAFLVSQTERDMAVDSIHKAKPEYIFVDADMETPYELDIAPANIYGAWLHTESRMRVLAMNALRDVYREVAKEYELVDEGLIIKVYKRKQSMNDANIAEIE